MLAYIYISAPWILYGLKTATCRPWGFSRRTGTRTLALSVISMPCCRAWRLMAGEAVTCGLNSVHSASLSAATSVRKRWTKDDKGRMIVGVIITDRDHWRDWVKCFLEGVVLLSHRTCSRKCKQLQIGIEVRKLTCKIMSLAVNAPRHGHKRR